VSGRVGEVGFVSVRVRRGRLCVATCLLILLVSELVGRGFLVSRHVRRGLVSVGACSVRSA